MGNEIVQWEGSPAGELGMGGMGLSEEIGGV